MISTFDRSCLIFTSNFPRVEKEETKSWNLYADALCCNSSAFVLQSQCFCGVKGMLLQTNSNAFAKRSVCLCVAKSK